MRRTCYRGALAFAILTPLAAQEDCTHLDRGCGEFNLGVGGHLAEQRNPIGAPALQLGVAFGLTRHAAVVGSYAHTWFASAGSARVRFHEAVGGVRIALPARVAPYALGLIGAEGMRVSIASASASDTRAVFGGGAGVAIPINRHVGIFAEARFMLDRHRNWYARPTVGFHLRGR